MYPRQPRRSSRIVLGVREFQDGDRATRRFEPVGSHPRPNAVATQLLRLRSAAQPPYSGRSRWSLRLGFDGRQRTPAGVRGVSELPRRAPAAAAASARRFQGRRSCESGCRACRHRPTPALCGRRQQRIPPSPPRSVPMHAQGRTRSAAGRRCGSLSRGRRPAPRPSAESPRDRGWFGKPWSPSAPTTRAQPPGRDGRRSKGCPADGPRRANGLGAAD